VGEALQRRRRIRLLYHTRGRGERGWREVSPQRLVHYRHTWYVDAWCHKAEGMRRFALDAFEEAELLETRARDVSVRQVAELMDAGYGIYAGARRQWATLVFEPQAAQWVGREQWHPEQEGQLLEDGRYQLRVPYTDETELVMDVLRHGAQVRVVAPAALVRNVARQLREAAEAYAA
jgi:predicted DNA-binding transcriptional regulator YafY